MYFFYICNLTNDYTKMKKKIMNVCGMAFLAISVLACSGQKKGATDTVVSADNVKIVADVMTSEADSTGYIVRVGEIAPDFTNESVFSPWQGRNVAVYSKLVRCLS